MFQILITHRPSSTFGSDAPEALAEPTPFAGFRSTVGTRYGYLTGQRPEVRLAGNYGHGERQPARWVTREAAERNLHHLIARGYTARIEQA
jgi:hypothetical protein